MPGDLDEDLTERDGIGRERFRSGRAGGGGEGYDGAVEFDLGVEFRIIRVRAGFGVGLFQAPSSYRQANPQGPQHIPRSYPLPPPSRYSDPGRKGWVYGLAVDPARDVTGRRPEGDRIQGAVEELVSPAPGHRACLTSRLSGSVIIPEESYLLIESTFLFRAGSVESPFLPSPSRTPKTG
jgi:hypothetical protein